MRRSAVSIGGSGVKSTTDATRGRSTPLGAVPFQMEARGLIRGELGEFFMLPDSRNCMGSSSW